LTGPLNKFTSSSLPNCTFCSFDCANIQSAIGYGSTASGVLKCVPTQTGIQNSSWCQECSKQTQETVRMTAQSTLTLLPVHGWGYRRYVVANIEKVRGVSLAKTEFDYTTAKTNNISNFSAWHNRANLIPTLLPPVTATDFEHERKAFLAAGLSYTHPKANLRT
jgi:hypothetical protein